MNRVQLPSILALGVMCLCGPAWATTTAPDQQSTAHKDTEFLKDANQGSVNEVDLAKYVLTKTSSEDVRQFAQKMVDDHTKLLESMKPFDMEAGVDIPDHPDMATEATKLKLKVLSGKDFDKAYIKDMVEDHQKDLEAFRKEAKETGYPTFKEAVEKGSTVVEGHLEMINQIAKKNGIAPAHIPKS